MKCVILAGGFGTRISEETHLKPKPMLEIGEKPLLWHIMKIYSFYGIDDFIICCGYKGYVIKEYFANYFLHMSDVTIDMKENKTEVHKKFAEPWKVTLVDTGINTMTGGRLKRIKKYVEDETFCFTYGDGLSDVSIKNLIKYHQDQKTIATLTAVQPPGRFGTVNINKNLISTFKEKIAGDGNWINGGSYCYPRKITEPLLSTPKKGFVNFHPGPLPKYKGPTELIEAIRNKETHWGVTVHYMDKEYDMGPIILIKKIELHEPPTSEQELGPISHYFLFHLFKETIKEIYEEKYSHVKQ